jgi:hypothetical protein
VLSNKSIGICNNAEQVLKQLENEVTAVVLLNKLEGIDVIKVQFLKQFSKLVTKILLLNKPEGIGNGSGTSPVDIKQ